MFIPPASLLTSLREQLPVAALPPTVAQPLQVPAPQLPQQMQIPTELLFDAAGNALNNDLQRGAPMFSLMGQAALGMGNSPGFQPNVGLGALGGAMSGFATAGPLGGLIGGVMGGLTTARNRESYESLRELYDKQRIKDKTVSGNLGYYAQFGGETPGSTQTQTEKGEIVLFPNNMLTDVMATKRHKQMDDGEVTDILPDGSYVFSNDPTMKFNVRDTKDKILGYGMSYYDEHGDYDTDKMTMGDFLPKSGKMTFAQAADVLRRTIKTSGDRKDLFDIATDSDNLETRVPYLMELISMQDEKNTSAGRVGSSLGPEMLQYGDSLRVDGTKKGPGFLGTLKSIDGKDMTEFSIGVEFDGKQMEIPTLIPTLTEDEIRLITEKGQITPEIERKAIEHAKMRMAQGMPVFNKQYGGPGERAFAAGMGAAGLEMPPEVQKERIVDQDPMGPMGEPGARAVQAAMGILNNMRPNEEATVEPPPAPKVKKKLSGPNEGYRKTLENDTILDRVYGIFDQYGIEDPVARSIMVQESHGDPNAESKAGYVGLFQLHPNTSAKDWNVHGKKHPRFKDIGEITTKDELKDPEVNAVIGQWYLKDRLPKIIKSFGFEDAAGINSLVAAAYNMGPGNLRKHMNKYPRKNKETDQEYVKRLQSNFPEETKNYIERLWMGFNRFQHPRHIEQKKYGSTWTIE